MRCQNTHHSGPAGIGKTELLAAVHRLAGRGADPEEAARLILALASGRADRLSGRHLSVSENLDALLPRIDQIERDDLHTLRLRTGH